MATLMQNPTVAELETAIQVLASLGERLNTEAAYSIIQMPKTQLGDHYAGDIGSATIEQNIRINVVATKLKNWQEELSAQESLCIQAQKSNVQDKSRAEDRWSKTVETGFQRILDTRDSFQKARAWLGYKYKGRSAI
jgi:hypothetical protein